MALKPHRVEDQFHQRMAYYMDEAAERGGVAVLLTTGPGNGWKTYMGDTLNVVTYAATAAGKKPIGVLMNDMVPLSANGLLPAQGFADQMPVGGKCTLLSKGEVHTNKITGTPVGGDIAYLGANGTITPTSGTPVVGTFLTAKDADGYAILAVNCI